MAIPVFHPCRFHFDAQDIRVSNATVSGGVALNGYEDVTETTGGGYWLADFSGADFGDRTETGRLETLEWRRFNAVAGNEAAAVDVIFCDRWHQPVKDLVTYPDNGSSVYAGTGAVSKVLAVRNGQTGGLRCTILDISLVSERPLIGGERFTHVHPSWGPRAYEVQDVSPTQSGLRIAFHPPIRGGVKVGDDLDFDTIRCRMRRVGDVSNSITSGIYGAGDMSFKEDMRAPFSV